MKCGQSFNQQRLRPERGAKSPRESERGWAASAKATASCAEASRRRGPASIKKSASDQAKRQRQQSRDPSQLARWASARASAKRSGVCVAAGAPGITVHPRADARHITLADVRQVSAQLRSGHKGIEFNIEGDPRPDLLELVHEVKPDQCTLVPVRDGEITSQAGWPASTPVSRPADDHP